MAKKLLIATFGVAGALLGGKKKAAAPAATTPERVMPLADSEQVARARKDSILRQQGRTGRSSTILTGGSPASTFGGP